MQSEEQGQSRVVRLIRCRDTGRYIGEREWVSDARDAYPFQDTAEAIEVCIQHELINVELEVKAANEHFWIPLR